MSAFGSTPHLHLSQYTDTDHPSYVSDYTEDMGRIDAGFNLAQTNALAALNRVAALEQSVGSAGAVGQTVSFSAAETVDGDVFDEDLIWLGFGSPLSTKTRNAEPTDVPWTWESTGPSVRPKFTDHGVYRITVEADASYSPSLNISSAYMYMAIGSEHCIPLVHYRSDVGGKYYHAAGSFVIPYAGDGAADYIEFDTYFNASTVSNASIQCKLTVDVEQLSTQYSEQPSPVS